MTTDKSNAADTVAATKTKTTTTQQTNGKPKEKRRSNEKRKEKSRDAARSRRSRETEIFTDLAQVLPLPKDMVDQLDKASIMRVAIAYLKIRDVLHLFPKVNDIPKESSEKPDTTTTNNTIIASNNDEEYSQPGDDTKEPKPFDFDFWKAALTSKNILDALDGFMIILSNDGDVTYVSENINEYLGISKIDMLGQQIWEYSHQCDHDELKEALNCKKIGLSEKVKDENLIEEGITTDHRDLFIRLKCTLTSRGRSVNIKSASYKVIHITGHLVVNAKGDRVLIAVGRPIPHPSNIEIPLGTTTFLTKHSLDMKFTYVDDKMDDLFGYKPEDLLDKSLYECHHGGDSESLIGTFKCALSKGQGETCRYRFLGKCGGYCWIVTQATIVYDKQKPQSVVCVNYVISNLENNNEIYSLAQFEASQQLEKIDSNVKISTSLSSPQPQIVIEQQKQIQQEQPIIELTTTNITENKPKPIIIQQSQQNQQEKDQSKFIDLEKTDLVPKLSKKTCVDVDEKISTSAAELQNNLKRENPNNINITINDIKNININKSLNKPIIITTNSEQTKFVPTSSSSTPSSVTSSTLFRNTLQHRPDLLYGRNTPPLSTISKQTKFVEEKRPKSVTASVFRIATDKLPINAFNTNSNTIALNQSSNFAQLNVAPSAQSVTASVFTPLRGSQQKNFAAPSLATAAATTATTNHQKQQSSSATGQRCVEMNKGYHLSFADDTTGLTMLKEEPDGLDENGPLFNEMLAGLMSYGGLLQDDVSSLDSQNSAGNQTNGGSNNKGHIDPFINYREESNDTNCSQHLLSPGGASKSPEASSLPSLCSPNSLSQEDDFPFMTMNVDDEIDLSMRAPYIPMNEQEDLPLLTDDLMWGVGFPSEDLTIHKDEVMQYNTLKQQINLSPSSTTNNRIMLNNNNQNCHNSTNLSNSSPSASPMSIMSSSSAASSPSPCSPHSSISSSMHNQSNFGGAMLCNASGGGGGGGGGDGSGGCGSSLCVDDSDSGISSINSMSPQHTHQQHHRQHQHQQQNHHLSHHQHQTHQQQQHHSPMSLRNDGLGLITCKKEIDGGNLCESIDAFDSVYTKDSSNLDCWTVQDLLNINSTEANIAIDNNLQQQTNKQQVQNIIINTATMPATTLHVPLITIQNNKNLSMNHQQQQQQQQPDQRSTSSPLEGGTTIVATNSASNCHNSSSSNKQQQQQQQCGGNLILSEEIIQNNRKLSPKIPTSNTAATIRIATSGNIGRHQTSPKTTTILHTTNLTALQGNNHKRHITSGGASTLDSKRLKNSSNVEIQTSLLQQLMAPAPQKQKVVVRTAAGYDKSQASSRWNNENGGGLTQQQQMLRNSDRDHHLNQSLNSSSASNSVLKNLLISGCDNAVANTFPEIMITDEEAIAQLSPCDSLKTLDCEASRAKVMRSLHSNPMIGGPRILPSPPFPTDDLNPPALCTISDNDSSSDSGIDDIRTPRKITSIIKDVKPTTHATEKLYFKFGIPDNDVALKHEGLLIANSNSNTGVTTPLPFESPNAGNYHRKTSISFMDNGNPLMTEFYIDLINDDYTMTENEYEITQSLNDLQ